MTSYTGNTEWQLSSCSGIYNPTVSEQFSCLLICQTGSVSCYGELQYSSNLPYKQISKQSLKDSDYGEL
jgi:hypothetical protein